VLLTRAIVRPLSKYYSPASARLSSAGLRAANRQPTRHTHTRSSLRSSAASAIPCTPAAHRRCRNTHHTRGGISCELARGFRISLSVDRNPRCHSAPRRHARPPRTQVRSGRHARASASHIARSAPSPPRAPRLSVCAAAAPLLVSPIERARAAAHTPRCAHAAHAPPAASPPPPPKQHARTPQNTVRRARACCRRRIRRRPRWRRRRAPNVPWSQTARLVTTNGSLVTTTGRLVATRHPIATGPLAATGHPVATGPLAATGRPIATGLLAATGHPIAEDV